MTEKSLAIIGIAVMISVIAVSSAFAHDSHTVILIVGLATLGGGQVLSLWKLGANTEKTETIEKNVNGIVEARVQAAYKEAYARGCIDGASAEQARAKDLAKETAAVAAATATATAVAATQGTPPSSGS